MSRNAELHVYVCSDMVTLIQSALNPLLLNTAFTVFPLTAKPSLVSLFALLHLQVATETV